MTRAGGNGQAGPLAGVRAVEISYQAGAVAGRILADLGAEVIKIEPDGGEASRMAEPCATLPDGGRISYFWLGFNVSKRSMCLDLATQEGRRAFAGLMTSTDIVVTDYQRLSKTENDELAAMARQANPSIIWTEIWPFGRDIPFVATDTTLQAMGGHLFLNGDIDRPPVPIGVPVAIMQGGAEAASAALMAYYHRLKTGTGQRVDISIQECIVWTLLNTTMAWQLLGLTEMRGGAVRKERANRFYTRLVWPCRDGHIFFGPVGGGGGAAREKSYAALVAWMREEGAADAILMAQDWNGPEQFSIPQTDYDAVTDVIGRFIQTKTVDELMERAVKDRILLAPVAGVSQILQNKNARHRGFYDLLEDAGRALRIEYPARWAKFSETPLCDVRAAPAVGEA
ncbi:CoA transferase [Ferrovibrio xuzhouensis]|uniref:CoA transferase n=1 Tax=Ferrovibrio xuzhouensis TaxID=1576914 RepID=A0ABV7VBQ1_9PROT